MIDKQQTEKVFRRLFKGGVMRRVPRNREDAEIFLALAASTFDPQVAYSEAEVNEHLLEWLVDFACPPSLDHVTVRRYLVDFFFLLRDASGASYRTNQTIINKAIKPEARSIQPRYILEDVQREKARRRRAATQ